ncbi:nucleotidyltransferase domain-containing protein [Salinispira pacifica]|uniref:Polymerase beta nucleotidyltransferase domain-containing protein n=1 Tax=Salinispira pacifica TaxID=1307761 RepID=V5WNF7_9SPIO|nr:nucleotidyltransferase domain-containing protein [Salinispira pacifica]AHC16521.1 hypothetical protein L21SP2_3181 [Salinispira pacifica]
MDPCRRVSNIPGLSAEINEKLREIFAEFHEIQACILYGSRAKGTHRHASDVDITLVTHSIEIDRVGQCIYRRDNNTDI